jgi:hypothetical protein
MDRFESKRCVWRRDVLCQSEVKSGIVSCALEALGAPDQVVAQVPEEKLNGHLEKMAEEEGVTEIRELRAFLPATELGGAFVPEERRELLARHPALFARDPETIFDGGRRHIHRTQRKVNGWGSLFSLLGSATGNKTEVLAGNSNPLVLTYQNTQPFS